MGIYFEQLNGQPNSFYTTDDLAIYGNTLYGVLNNVYELPVLVKIGKSRFIILRIYLKLQELLQKNIIIP